LGVSSPQIDEAARGFSFKKDGPLDMRMDTSQGETAAQFIARATTNELAEVIKNYGEERFAVPVAKALVACRDKGIQLTTTAGLAAVVAQTLRACGARVERGQDPATRTFQALRIYVNRELEELQSGLDAMFGLLMPRARLAVISFHSLEDRIVKHFMRDKSTQAAPPKGVPVRADALPPAAARLVGKPIRPSEAEVAANPRARSAILRVLERAA
jgi:16S rRNA (cytosine1402-N4)-methyltransferase